MAQAFTGLNSTTGTLHRQLIQPLACGSALSGFNAGIAQLAEPARLQAIATAQAAVKSNDGTDLVQARRLAAHLAAIIMQALDNKSVLGVNGIVTVVVTAVLQELAAFLLPNKIPQRVKRCLRREARKPTNMGAKT